MAKTRTEKSKFRSDFGDRWISASQFVAEKMCQRKVKNEGRSLPPDFWLLPQWKSQYINLVTAASALIKEFGELPVLKALEWKDLEWCSSIRAKQFRQAVICEYNKLLVQSEEERPVRQIENQNSEFGNSFVKSNKLRGL